MTEVARIYVQVPLALPSVANLHRHKHWGGRAALVSKQREAVAWALKKEFATRYPSVPCRVVLVRSAPRLLDAEDNLGMALKAVKDQVADMLGVTDRDQRVRWVLDQDKASIASVHITIEWEPGGEVLPPLHRQKVARMARKGPETESTGARLRRLATSATYRPGGKR